MLYCVRNGKIRYVNSVTHSILFVRDLRNYNTDKNIRIFIFLKHILMSRTFPEYWKKIFEKLRNRSDLNRFEFL